jgi:hypothetical protein
MILDITDIPDDQGGWVQLQTVRSGYDFADEVSLPVSHYGVWRRVDAALVAEALASVPRGAAPVPAEIAKAFPNFPLFAHDGGTFVAFAPGVATATFPPGTWQWVGTVPALQQDSYLVVAPAAYLDPTTFVVTTHTTTPSIWFVSATQVGQSVDNLAPGVPSGFAVAYNTGSGNTLSWSAAPESDFQYFRVYRSTDPGFVPSPATLVHETATPGWIDPDYDGGPVYYKVTALDFAGNESGPASATVTAVGGSVVPETAALYQNHPNPFNPSTQIRYDVPRGGAYVQLAIFDVSGKQLRVLVSGRQTEGQKSLAWDGGDERGAPVATGVYFCRAIIGNAVLTRKMTMLK